MSLAIAAATAAVVTSGLIVALAGTLRLARPSPSHAQGARPVPPVPCPVPPAPPAPPRSRLTRAMQLLYQDRDVPSPWSRVGIVTGSGIVFNLHRRRDRARGRWEHRVVDTHGVTINLDRARYHGHLHDGTTVDVPAYGPMEVQNDPDDEFRRHFEEV